MSGGMHILYSSGEPYESGHGVPGREYARAEAAKVAAEMASICPWSAIDRDGNLVLGYVRAGVDKSGMTPVRTRQMAARLAR